MRRDSRKAGAVRRRWPMLAVLLSLCSGGGASAQDVMVEGRKLFTTGAVPACAVCHSLKDAGAAGEIGPSLDEIKPDAARVAKAVRNGIGQMPAFGALSEAQVKLLSQYVARATGATK